MIKNIVIIDKTKNHNTLQPPGKSKYHDINYSNYFMTSLLTQLDLIMEVREGEEKIKCLNE